MPNGPLHGLKVLVYRMLGKKSLNQQDLSESRSLASNVSGEARSHHFYRQSHLTIQDEDYYFLLPFLFRGVNSRRVDAFHGLIDPLPFKFSAILFCC